ncbi:MAG: sigma-70 family RNA polymerase sigma factor [Planctomycetaceae bacterium]|nr:sigma-70 family RNA polymerase sigma factor [Planctomycetaceae bacterium]
MKEKQENSRHFQLDSELLTRFVKQGDEAALTALINKHSRLVLSICHQIVWDRHEAEDVFQTVFLRLVKNASTIRNGAYLTSWLYRVAYHEACQVHRQRKKQNTLEYDDEIFIPENMTSPSPSKQHFLVLHEEVERLPERYRSPVILCYLNGLTRREAADELEVTDATVKARLTKGRELLRQRLLKRGVALAAIIAAWQTEYASAASLVSSGMIDKTIEQCLLESTTGAGSLASSASAPSQGINLMPTLSGTNLAIAVGGVVLAVAGLIAAATLTGSDEESATNENSTTQTDVTSNSTSETSEASETAQPVATGTVGSGNVGTRTSAPRGAGRSSSTTGGNFISGSGIAPEQPPVRLRGSSPEEQNNDGLQFQTAPGNQSAPIAGSSSGGVGGRAFGAGTLRGRAAGGN